MLKHKIKKRLKKASELPLFIIGYIVQVFSRTIKKPIIFVDKYGNKFWQYPTDSIAFNWMRSSVTDSDNVLKYVLRNLEEGEIAIDIGSHIGSISVALWSKVGKQGKVISVDADHENIERLTKNLQLNNFPRQYTVCIGISNLAGTRQLTCYPDSSGWQTLGEPSFAKEYRSFKIDIQTINFSDLLDLFELDKVDFVKIDTEGSELAILQGMSKYLKDKKIERIVFEVNYLMLEGMDLDVDDLINFWQPFDYELWELSNDGIFPFNVERYREQVGDCLAVLRNN